MKILEFLFRGNVYLINEQGHINANGIGYFSNNWIFIGGSKHHWRQGIDVSLADAFKDPKLLNGCLGWDKDHGTTRQWGGQWLGKLPRIYSAHVKELTDAEIKEIGRLTKF